MNNLETLSFYTVLQLFRTRPETVGASLQFPSTLTLQQRRIVQSLAVKLNLDHATHKFGSEWCIIVRHHSTRYREQSPQDLVPFPLIL
jgi:hypothetical protein